MTPGWRVAILFLWQPGSLVVAQTVCKLPVPLPTGYLVPTACSSSKVPLPASDCTSLCDESSWYFGQATVSCLSGTALDPGTFSFSGCSAPICPEQCGSSTPLATSASNSEVLALVADPWASRRLLAADAARHIVIEIDATGSSTRIVWGRSGTPGDRDGRATGAARLNTPKALALAGDQRLLFVADSGNGKVRVLSISSSQVTTVARDFSEPSGLALSEVGGSWQLLVADAGAGKVLKLPLPDTAFALKSTGWPSGQGIQSAVRLTALAGATGLSRPTWLAYWQSGQEAFVTEDAGQRRVLRIPLDASGTKEILRQGSFSGDLSAVVLKAAALSKPGALALDGLTSAPTLYVADRGTRQIFAVELTKSSKSCSELGWDQDSMMELRGSPRVCGRSHGSRAAVGELCNSSYDTYSTGLCCSGEVDFSIAQEFCSRQGARLCSAEELREDEARDVESESRCETGPSVVYDGPYDEASIWTSSPCFVAGTDTPGFLTRSGARQFHRRSPDECLAPSGRAFVKCCADRDYVMPVAGAASPIAGVDGHALFRQFSGSALTALFMDQPRRLMFAAAGNQLYTISWSMPRSVIAGTPGFTDVMNSPSGLAWDWVKTRLLVADSKDHVIRRVDVYETGKMQIVAGIMGQGVDTGDQGPSVAGTIDRPLGLALDLSGMVAYVSTGSHRVRRVELFEGGKIWTMVNRDGDRGMMGDGGPAVEVQLANPQGLHMDDDKLFIADRGNHRIRLLNFKNLEVDSIAGPVMLSAAGPELVPTGVVESGGGSPTGIASYSLSPDPNITSAHPPRDLMQTTPVGVAASADGKVAIISDEHSASFIYVDRSTTPREVKVLLGDTLTENPKDLLMASNGTVFVADHGLHSIFAFEFSCDEVNEDSIFFGSTAGCHLKNFRHVAGSGEAGDGDIFRRQPPTVTATKTFTFTTTRTTTLTPLMCWNHVLGRPGEDCDETCAIHGGTCDPTIAEGFNFSHFRHTLLVAADAQGVDCERDARDWWDNVMPAYESDMDSRDYGSCLGTWNIPATVACDGIYLVFGKPSKSMRRWCKCRNEEMCTDAFTTSTTLGQAWIPTTTTTMTMFGMTSTRTSTTFTSVSTTFTTLPTTTTPSPYVQRCPDGYPKLHPPPPLGKDTTFQESARSCAVLCEVSSGCVAFTYDATVSRCKLHPEPDGDFPVSKELTSIHFTACQRDPARGDLTLELLLVDWMFANDSLKEPGAMALDEKRQLLYFCDSGNDKVKVLNLTSMLMMTVAGLGPSQTRFSGDGQPAREATLWGPRGLALEEATGYLYISDTKNHVIRRVKLAVNRLTGIIETVAGSGVGGYGTQGETPLLTRFRFPWGLAVGKGSGGGTQLYVADSSNNQVWMVNFDSVPVQMQQLAGFIEGQVFTTEEVGDTNELTAVKTAGSIPLVVGDGGPGLLAQVEAPRTIFAQKNAAGVTQEILFSEPKRERLRQLDMTSKVIDTTLETFAFNFTRGEGLIGIVPLDYDAGLSLPYGIAAKISTGLFGTLYTASYGSGEVRVTDLESGITQGFAGRKNIGWYLATPGAGDGGPAEDALLMGPVDLELDNELQLLYIAEADSGRIRRVDLTTNIITSLASAVPLPDQSGSLYSITLDQPRQILFASAPNDHVVYKLDLQATPCTAPLGIADASAPSCEEGSDVNQDTCTARCSDGFEPAPAQLHCSGGVLTPPTFQCRPSPCRAPWGVENAALTPCLEGAFIQSGSQCTSVCRADFRADANLSCVEGRLSPADFSCIDTRTTSPPPATQEVIQATNDSSSSSATMVESGGAASLVVAVVEPSERNGPTEFTVASIFDDRLIYDPEAARRSSVPVNGSFSFEALTAGLSLEEAQLMVATEALKRPLQAALARTLSLLLSDVTLLAVAVDDARRLRETGRKLGSLTHRYRVAFSVNEPTDWVPARIEALRVGTEGANGALAKALEAVRFAQMLAEVSANKARPCKLPPPPSHSPLVSCQEGQASTASYGNCTTRCFDPWVSLPSQLVCFAGFWSPPSFTCVAPEEKEPPTCAAPENVQGAVDSVCSELMAGERLQEGSVCTPACLPGLVASESMLACSSGFLRPPTFACQKPECDLPGGIAHAASHPCLEGFDEVPPGRQCTAACQAGFRPTANLTCLQGTLFPSRFACSDAAIADSAFNAAGAVWGSMGAGGVALRRTTSTSPVPETSALNSSGLQREERDGEEASDNVLLMVVIGCASGLLAGVCITAAVAFAVFTWRRRRRHKRDEIDSSWEQAVTNVQEAIMANSVVGSNPSKENWKGEKKKKQEKTRKRTSDEEDMSDFGEDFEHMDGGDEDDILAVGEHLKLQMDGLKVEGGSADVKQLLRSAATTAEVVTPEVEQKKDTQSDILSLAQAAASEAISGGSKQDLLSFAQAAAAEATAGAKVEEDPSDLLAFAQLAASQAVAMPASAGGRDAKFDAMESELATGGQEEAAFAGLRRLNPGSSHGPKEKKNRQPHQISTV